MRKIKFRAWDKKEQIGMINNPILAIVLEDDRYIVMQYTGLLDKQEKEIYEGDIIKKPDYINEKGKLIKTKSYEIIFEKGGYHAKNGFHLSMSVDEYEVIGNIYENPKMMNNERKDKEIARG